MHKFVSKFVIQLMCVYIQINVQINVCMLCVCMCMGVYMYVVCACMYMYVCVCVCMLHCVCVCLSMCVKFTYVCSTIVTQYNYTYTKCLDGESCSQSPERHSYTQMHLSSHVVQVLPSMSFTPTALWGPYNLGGGSVKTGVSTASGVSLPQHLLLAPPSKIVGHIVVTRGGCVCLHVRTCISKCVCSQVCMHIMCNHPWMCIRT